MITDILYDMPRPKPLTPLKPILLKLPEPVVEKLDVDRNGTSRAAYISALICAALPPERVRLLPAAYAAARPDIAAELKRERPPAQPKAGAKRVIGFDPQTGEPIYG
jgi:hypothetical protein